MRKPINLALVVLLLLCLVGWGGYAKAQRETGIGHTWEYLVFSPIPGSLSLQEQLNHLGSQGWELVSTQPGRTGPRFEPAMGQPSPGTVYYFKRPK
jgi:hypothetical protein